MGKGEAFSILSALSWAYGVILYKRLGDTWPPLQLNLLKNTVVLAMLLPALALWHGLQWPGLPPMQVAIALASGALGIALADTLYLRALNQLGAGRMGIVGNLYSPFVLLLSFLFLDERLSALQFAGFGLVSLGVLIISRQALPSPLEAGALRRGVLLGASSILLMALAVVMVKRTLEAYPLLWVVSLRVAGGVAGVALLFVLTRRDRQREVPAGPRPWRQLVLAAFVGQFVALLLWMAGYKYTSASIAAILNETASIFIVLLAWLLLREPLSRRKLVGIACTLSGVYCMLA